MYLILSPSVHSHALKAKNTSPDDVPWHRNDLASILEKHSKCLCQNIRLEMFGLS